MRGWLLVSLILALCFTGCNTLASKKNTFPEYKEDTQHLDICVFDSTVPQSDQFQLRLHPDIYITKIDDKIVHYLGNQIINIPGGSHSFVFHHSNKEGRTGDLNIKADFEAGLYFSFDAYIYYEANKKLSVSINEFGPAIWNVPFVNDMIFNENESIVSINYLPEVDNVFSIYIYIDEKPIASIGNGYNQHIALRIPNGKHVIKTIKEFHGKSDPVDLITLSEKCNFEADSQIVNLNIKTLTTGKVSIERIMADEQ